MCKRICWKVITENYEPLLGMFITAVSVFSVLYHPSVGTKNNRLCRSVKGWNGVSFYKDFNDLTVNMVLFEYSCSSHNIYFYFVECKNINIQHLPMKQTLNTYNWAGHCSENNWDRSLLSLLIHWANSERFKKRLVLWLENKSTSSHFLEETGCQFALQ